MAIIITDKSADEFLSNLSNQRSNLVRVRRDFFSDSQKDLPLSLIPHELDTLHRPINILVNQKIHHAETSLFHRYGCSHNLPPESFLRIDANILTCSPELTFVRMGAHLRFAELVALGCEYCGTYSLNSLTKKAEYGLEPLTSSRKIQQYIDCIPPVKGIQRARLAARFIADDSASPMETALFMTLCLPSVFGGYGLPRAKLNHPVKLNDAAKKIYPHGHCKCDLFFEDARLDLEYHGVEFHFGKSDDDNARAYALEVMGCRSLAISKSQFNDVEALGEIAREVAKAHGRKPKKSSMVWTDAREKLREDLRAYLSRNGRA